MVPLIMLLEACDANVCTNGINDQKALLHLISIVLRECSGLSDKTVGSTRH